MEHLTFAGSQIVATSPEGRRESLPISELARALAPAQMDTGHAVLPERVRAVRSGRVSTVWVHQSPPAVYNLRWITDDSPEPFGKDATYRDVRIALPYVIVLVVFEPARHGIGVSSWNECFFRNAPLRSLDDELLYPALLNCSRFEPPARRPLSWICTQNLVPVPPVITDPNRRMWEGYAALLRCLFETAFNRSSEMHEGTSWYEVSRSVDPRIATVSAWEAASAEDPAFALDVPWKPTGLSLGTVIDRTFRERGELGPRITTEQALARVILRKGQKLRLEAKQAKAEHEKMLADEAASLALKLF